MKILVVEDEAGTLGVIRDCVTQTGYTCYCSRNGREALRTFEDLEPDLIILDLTLPDMSGLDICAHIRRSGASKDPYIMIVTARTEDQARIDGFLAGADDYVVKPFNPQELSLRIQAMLRRSGRQQTKYIETPHLLIDVDAHKVLIMDGDEGNGRLELIDLTPHEFNLLVALAETPGRVWSRNQLLDQVWGSDYAGVDRIVDVYVMRVRQKTKTGSNLIKTKLGVGYFFEDS
jgi:DNA-binding response OmpR family regulator